LVANENGHPTNVFGGVIFTRTDQANLNTLRDIKGKAIAVVSTESLGGYQMQAYELSRAGFHMPQDIQIIVTGMPHDKAVEAVLAGHAEVGFARSGVLESMIREGKLDLKQLKILNPQTHPDFPQQISTPLYPEWPFVAMPNVDGSLGRHVAAALFMLGDNETSTKAMGIHGFAVPADYSAVEDVLRELHLPPFDVVPHFTIRDIWSHYHWQLIGGGLPLA
jgi:ABC-type phosphate/phosphonate transport system substrate-binding protein